jgi:hypothetical protein
VTTIPEVFTAGDTVTWVESAVPSAANAAVAYLRANVPQGATLNGVLTSDGWEFTLAGNISAALPPLDSWKLQVNAEAGGITTTVNRATFTILPSLAYTGSPTALDLRSQNEKDLEAVEAAIRALVSGAQEYRIGFGNQGRTVRRADLSDLIQWRDRLASLVAAEKRAESGKTDRNVYVRFTPWD